MKKFILNQPHTYGLFAVCLHWLGAIAIIAMIYTGLVMADMPRGAEKLFYVDLHGSLGVSVAVIVFLRLVSYMFLPQPDKLSANKHVNTAGRMGHYILYVIMLAQVATGIMTIYTVGRAIDVFGLFKIPSPLQRDIPAHHFWEGNHVYLFYALCAMITLHLLAVVYHKIKGHQPLKRMGFK